MRVKTAELRNRLSYYLRQIRETEEPIEVCVREEPVALLMPLDVAGAPVPDPQVQREMEALRGALASVGLLLESPGRPSELPTLDPQAAGDGRQDIRTIEAIRDERSW